MGKVMYIEDSPETGFIINVFGKLLSSQEKQDLRESENDPAEVQKALKNNLILEVVTDFSIALKRLNKNSANYDLLIVDRDLYDNGLKYQPDELIQTEPAFNENYHKREGDFLIGFCKMKGYDIDNRFFIFTGNTDDLVQSPELKLLLSDKFKSENIIVKGSEGKDRLIEIIEELKDFELVLKNKIFIDVLKKLPKEKDDFAKLFLDLLKVTESDDVKTSLNSLRNILEAILTKSARRFETPIDYWNKGSLRCSAYIKNYLMSYNVTEDKQIYNHGTSSVIIEAMNTIYRIGSQFGTHNSNGYKPTVNTVNSLIYALKDIILWYGQIMEKK